MTGAVRLERMALDQNERIAEVVAREESRLRRFIRRRVPDARDAEDILQDVFSTLVEANRLLMPIDHITGWLFRVARNRIVDLFRSRRSDSLDDFADLLPSPHAGPEAAYARQLLLDELAAAIAELPKEQRDVFVGHEIQGRSFKEMAAASGVSVNTLLSRKRYAVLRLRERLRRSYDELTGQGPRR
jgi:RNA polymerase sigma factor (sigma-70 family)